MSKNNYVYDIDFSKVVPDYLNKVIDLTEREAILDFANMERRGTQRKFSYSESDFNEYIKSRASEIAFSSCKYEELKFPEKAVLASNIALDKEKFVNALNGLAKNSNSFGFDYLKQYVKLACYFSIKKDVNNLSKFDEKFYTFLIRYNKLICSELSNYFGYVKPHLIINMLNEIISFEPELLNSYKKSNHTK